MNVKTEAKLFESEWGVWVFGEVLNYALDESDDPVTFLRVWREGDWDRIKKEFPDFYKTEFLGEGRTIRNDFGNLK